MRTTCKVCGTKLDENGKCPRCLGKRAAQEELERVLTRVRRAMGSR